MVTETRLLLGVSNANVSIYDINYHSLRFILVFIDWLKVMQKCNIFNSRHLNTDKFAQINVK